MEILTVRGALPPHRYHQADITDAFAGFIAQSSLDEGLLRRLHSNAGVRTRHLTLPLEEYAGLGFEEFILSGYPHLEEAYWCGEGLLPELRRRGLVPDLPATGDGATFSTFR